MSRGPSGPSPARVLAHRALVLVDRNRRYLQPTLDCALTRRQLAPGERAFATRIAYGALQRKAYIDHVLSPLLRAPKKLPLEVRWALRAGAYEKLFLKSPDYATVSQWVEIAKANGKGFGGLVNAVLRRVERRPAPPWIEASIPRFLYEHWGRFFQSAAFVSAFNEPAPLWVAAFPGAKESLSAQGIEWTPGPLPETLAIQGIGLREVDAYRLGLIQPQNPASLFAATLLGAGPGDRVLDLAGGAGIKAAWLAARGAQVTSYDRDPRRQQSGAENLRRLGLAVTMKTRDLRGPLDAEAPLVLLDAPCTGTGTLRHHPEIRDRLEPGAIARAAKLQERLLETAAAATLPGGVLVYTVCSLTEEEGEAQIARFLERHPEFHPEPIETPFRELRRGLGVYVSPEGGLDGFYYAKLRKRPAP